MGEVNIYIQNITIWEGDMQDLEELKFRVAIYAENGLTEIARDLIARCESAEKELATIYEKYDCNTAIMLARTKIMNEQAEELKGLREQKPVGWMTKRDSDPGFPRLHKNKSDADFWRELAAVPQASSEHHVNQCDGCVGDYPIKNGLHYNDSHGKSLPFMVCCAKKYHVECTSCRHKQADGTNFCEECGFDELIRS